MARKKEKETLFLKVIYFDESTAQDYIDIVNGGRLDWSKEENKEKIAKILAEIEAEAQAGFNVISFIKAMVSSNVNTSASNDISRVFETTLKNTLLTDYISVASKDSNVKKFENSGVYAPDNSISLYRMYSSYLTIVPAEQMPINMEKLNKALLGERGYYAMLLTNETEPTCVLRFNVKAFKNNYNLADLSKMQLTYYGVKVGSCTREQLNIDKEFEHKPKKVVMAADNIIDGTVSEQKDLDVYDIVLAGVMCE